MKKRTLRTLACLLLVGSVLAAFAAMATGAGSQGDPLVTLSYLNETFLGEVLQSVDEKLADRNALLRQETQQAVEQAQRELLEQLGSGAAVSGGGAVSYVVVELSDGQLLHGGAGCEVLLRRGSAHCVAEDRTTPGLVDTTSGGSIGHGGALAEDHLYLLPAARSIQATGAVTLLVRGDYAIQ